MDSSALWSARQWQEHVRACVGGACECFLQTKEPYPVGLLTGLLESVIKRRYHHRGLIMDGYPKTPTEVVDAADMCRRLGMPITHVMEISISKRTAWARVQHRIICSQYQYSAPAKLNSESCPFCGGNRWIVCSDEDNAVDFNRRYKNYKR